MSRTFQTQGEAETWLGEFYPSLMSAGVRAVSLYEADRLVYGPMSLEPDGLCREPLGSVGADPGLHRGHPTHVRSGQIIASRGLRGGVPT